MRETGSFGSGYLLSAHLAARGLRMAAILLGIGLAFGSAPLHAQDGDEEDSRTFEQKLMDNFMSGLGAKKLEDGNIEYRERSPLVIPSKIALPPPQTGKAKLAPNWPKDPDEAERKAAIERSKQKAVSPEEARRPLMPSEMVEKKPRRGAASGDTSTPGNNPTASIMMLPSQLGYNGGLFSGVLGQGKGEAEKFTSEPERTELTQPPVGYQTPSPNQAYGVGKLGAPTEKCDGASGRCEKVWQ